MEGLSNPFDSLREDISANVNISEQQLDFVLNAFVEKRLAKKEYLLQPGRVSNHMRFISEGVLRVFSLEETTEVITQFGIEGWWVNDLYSYLTQKPATQYIQALQPSVVLQIHRDSLERLFDEVPPVERFYRIKFQKAYTALQERHLKNISQTAIERYNKFRQQYRDIEQKVPQYMVASYLGITKEFLSTLRKSY